MLGRGRRKRSTVRRGARRSTRQARVLVAPSSSARAASAWGGDFGVGSFVDEGVVLPPAAAPVAGGPPFVSPAGVASEPRPAVELSPEAPPAAALAAARS